MLRSVFIDGFRSLNNFKLDLRPGLNVLVGPNGSGKTNILNAFWLISSLDSIDSLSYAGRTGSVDITRLFDVHKEKNLIGIMIEGDFDPDISDSDSKASEIRSEIGSEFNLKYKYGCELTQDNASENCLKFSKQSLEFEATYENPIKVGKCEKFKIKLENGKITVISADGLFTDKLPSSDFDSYFNSNNYVQKQRSIFHEFCREKSRLRSVMDKIAQNLDSTSICGDSLNLCGSKSKLPGFSLGVDRKEGGLLSKLHKIAILAENSGISNIQSELPNINYKDVHEKILGCLSQVSPEIQGLEVRYDEKKMLYFGDVKLVSEKVNESKIPFELLSEGTLKWLEIVTELLTTKKMLLVEKPEKYLHPALQRQFTNFARDVADFYQNIAILTTHSETVLDALDPSELIILKYRDRRTLVNRIKNVEGLKRVLHDNGFGLGWYYVSGALDNDSDHTESQD